jgi:hypothetical protein
MLPKIPRGRFLDIDELASLATWLVTEENSFSTGVVFDINRRRVYWGKRLRPERGTKPPSESAWRWDPQRIE